MKLYDDKKEEIMISLCTKKPYKLITLFPLSYHRIIL